MSIPDSAVMLSNTPPPAGIRHTLNESQPSFHRVPFVQINDRIEKGTRCRKRFRKYIETSATIERDMAQSMKADTNLMMILNELDAIPKSSVEATFRRLQEYTVSMAHARLEASKILLDSVSSFEHWSRVKKWNHSVYTLVQKAVGEVKTLEKKMDKSVLRHARAREELGHWKSVCEIATATLETNALNPEYQKSHQMTEARVVQALEEEKAAASEYLDSKIALIQGLGNSLEIVRDIYSDMDIQILIFKYRNVGRRDELVEQISGISQQLEEDRLDAIIDVLNQWIKTKQRVLETEREALAQVELSIGRLSRQETLQQFISDQHHPKLVHKHTKALHLLEWHFELHQESPDPLSSVSQQKKKSDETTPSLNPMFQQSKNNHDPSCQSYITKDIRANDIEVMKNFIASCFCTPEKSHIVKDILAKNMYKYRTRFIPISSSLPKTSSIYEHASVRLILISCLQTQRGRSQELSCPGYDTLGMVLECVLGACAELQDIKVAKSVMNMMQTFYVTKKTSVVYLTERLKRHDLWKNLWFWRDALLLGMDEEMSKCPPAQPWYHLPSAERLEEIRKVHNIIYGQIGTLMYNMSSIGIPRVNIEQFVQHVAQSFELPEHQIHQLQKQHHGPSNQQASEPPLAWSCAHMSIMPSGGSTFSNPQNVSKTTKTLKNIASYLNPFSSLSSQPLTSAMVSEETSESQVSLSTRPSPSSNTRSGKSNTSPGPPSLTTSILHNTAEEVTRAWDNLFGVEEKISASSVAAPPPPDIGNTSQRRRKGSPDPSLQFDTGMGSNTNTTRTWKKKRTKTSATPEKMSKSSTRSSSSSGDRKQRDPESSAKTTIVPPVRIPDETEDETQQSNRAAAHSIAQEFHHRHHTRKSHSATNIGEDRQKRTNSSVRSKSTKSMMMLVGTDEMMSTAPQPVVTKNDSSQALDFPQGVAAIRARFEKQHL